MNEENQPEADDDFNQLISGLSVVIGSSNLPLLEKFEVWRYKSATSYSEVMLLSFRQLQC